MEDFKAFDANISAQPLAGPKTDPDKRLSKKTRQQHKIESLRNLVNDSKFLKLLPIVDNQNIQISSYTVSDTIDGFVVKDTKTQKELSITTTKHAAIALVKDMLRNGDLAREIHVLD